VDTSSLDVLRRQPVTAASARAGALHKLLHFCRHELLLHACEQIFSLFERQNNVTGLCMIRIPANDYKRARSGMDAGVNELDDDEHTHALLPGEKTRLPYSELPLSPAFSTVPIDSG